MTRNPKLRRASDTKDELIDEIVRASARRAHPFDARRDIVGFLREYYRNVAVEDLRQSSPGELAAAALCHAALGASRKPGQHKIRVYNPSSERDGWQSTHTIIEIVNDDMPFLVDSTAMAIDRCGLGLHLTVHPLIRVTRTRAGKLKRFHPAATAEARVESFIRCEIDRVSHRATVGKLNDEIENTLSDVRAAVRDWAEMREQMRDCARQIDAYDLALDPTLSAESAHLLEWMADNHFTYLGYQEYSLDRNGQKLTLRPVNGTGLGLLSETRHDASEVQLTQAMRRHALSKEILIITKANSRSTIHRPTYLDYIGVKLFDESGTPVGERRFLGLFTSLAYSESPRNIPLLRLKVHRIVERSGLDPASHRGKALAHILDTYPRDELLQASVQDLARTSAAILNLQDRRQVRLFIRRDAFRRFFSCLVYVPRDKYNTRVRLRIEQILMDAFGGTGVDSAVEISDAVLARLHTIVHTAPGDKPKVSILKIESAIRGAVVTWQDRLRDALVERFGEEDGLDWFERYGAAFPLAYEEDNEPAAAADDVGRLHRAISGVAAPSETMFLFRTRDTAGHRALHFKLIRERSLPLSDALPVLENLGLRVISERPYGLTFPDGRRRWIQDFEVSSDTVASGDLGSLNESFAECFCGVLDGVIENDSFNQLIVRAGLTVREVVLVRTYAKYLLQLGLPFSQGYMERVLARHPRFARRFVETFAACFDPGQGTRGRRRREEKAERRLARATEKAATLDEDRILSAFAGALGATVRSNYYQRDDEGGVRAVLALKLTPGELDEAPQPRPRFEIFIYSPRVEGVHLRAGAIARGGIRWSDRKEDFRTEILGLMKAQTVKNTVIVPTGAKGGFVAKHLPRGDREAIGREVVACYEAFIGGLLDVTDNLDGDNVVPPPATVRRDDDDPYLVVAADKGTAAFSDIANGISEARGFWLGDAFASGGSAGYDHKKMGITARGAWEAVMRHFRELGVNTQRDEFTVIGIGDMGGDVFGNGMLLSRTIRLLAAFNHLHIFIDPDPNAAASFKERQRLFRLRRSTWEDYDKSLISKGGGVFSRAAKSIPLSREIRALLGTDAKSLSPLALINAILKAPADLLWNGGIGTYVKADAESHAEAGDRANDGLRVDATELNVRIVGEQIRIEVDRPDVSRIHLLRAVLVLGLAQQSAPPPRQLRVAGEFRLEAVQQRKRGVLAPMLDIDEAVEFL
ncbi:MAG: NAD-glutamate dehydrogenase domain-containing protein, partial [Pseudomonadota bacterium]